MEKTLTANESMFYQTIANISLITELYNNDFLNSEYYKSMDWSCAEINKIIISEILAKSGLGNPAMLQMYMYALLVMPKELLGDDFCKDKFNNEVKKVVFDYSSTYFNEDCKENINYHRHIRNAISHSKCEYNNIDGDNYVTFKDDNPRKDSQHCEITIKTTDVGGLCTFLLNELMMRLNNSDGSS